MAFPSLEYGCVRPRVCYGWPAVLVSVLTACVACGGQICCLVAVRRGSIPAWANLLFSVRYCASECAWGGASLLPNADEEPPPARAPRSPIWLSFTVLALLRDVLFRQLRGWWRYLSECVESIIDHRCCFVAGVKESHHSLRLLILILVVILLYIYSVRVRSGRRVGYRLVMAVGVSAMYVGYGCTYRSHAFAVLVRCARNTSSLCFV